jgi:hypothetical protein
MGYAKHIGRVGALAVTLGVGVAIVTTPGIAFADTTGSSTSDGASSSTGASDGASSSTGTSSTGTSSTGVSSTGTGTGTAGNQAPSSGPASPSDADDESGLDTDSLTDTDTDTDTDIDIDTDTATDVDVDDPVVDLDEEETPPPAGDEDAAPTQTPQAQDDDSAQTAGNGESARHQLSEESASEHYSTFSAASTDNVDPTIADGPVVTSHREQLQTFTVAIRDQLVGTQSPAPTATTRTAAVTTETASPKPTLVSIVTDFIDAVLRSMQAPGDGSPLQAPMLTAALFLVRNEFERGLAPHTTNATTQQSVTQVEDLAAPVVATDTHVLVIAIDGANLSRILADPENENFRALMATSTTGPASIVGHTTISNPSWTAIMTGVWGERTGVINNVFTPWTYDRFPTVFNQLEGYNSEIVTMAIGNWDVINAIAAAGSDPVDHNVFVGQVAGDTNWLATDDMVADLTINAISGADGTNPNFVFSYYVGVDENGHMYGGGSDEYRDALRNMDDNLGEIMRAIEASGEDWTVIVVTDHGHQSVRGLGHGFQSPNETETFVIAHGSDFKPGYINTRYQIVDTTPTVVKLFGATPRRDADGVPLMDLDASSVKPDDLNAALLAAIAQNHYPDALTNMALSVRTVFATIPYLIYTTGHDIAQMMPSFLVVPVQFVMDVLYVVTNIPAQIVAQLTGVGGASIFPVLPPPRPHFQPAEPPTLLLVRCGGLGAASTASCADAIVA